MKRTRFSRRATVDGSGVRTGGTPTSVLLGPVRCCQVKPQVILTYYVSLDIKKKWLYRSQTKFLSHSNTPESMFQVLLDLQSMQSDYTYIPRARTMWTLRSQHQLFHFDPLLLYCTNTEVISKITLCPSLFPWLPDSSFRLLNTTLPISALIYAKSNFFWIATVGHHSIWPHSHLFQDIFWFTGFLSVFWILKHCIPTIDHFRETQI